MSEALPIVFKCGGAPLIGIYHRGAVDARVGVVIIVGGPQYRVGSHRQFVLMARDLSSQGIPVFRFDYRGMGDSDSAARSFDAIDEDIRAAIDCFCAATKGLDKIVLLGLCDAASANLMYAAQDDRIRGLVLMNPWVRTPHGEAKAYLKHYYFQRFLQKSFWRKVVTGNFEFTHSIRQFLTSLQVSRSPGKVSGRNAGDQSVGFLDRMLQGFQEFQRPILVIISGRDLTAQEFVDLCKENNNWGHCLRRPEVTIRHLPDADHTMSSREQLNSATAVTAGWIAEVFEG